MMGEMNFWGDDEAFERDPAIRRGARAETRHAVKIGILSVGRTVCFGKGGSEAPKPDPLVGQAAQGNVQLGRESLDFAKQQYADGQVRQDKYDSLIDRVVNSDLASQDKSNQWAQQDRDLGLAGKGQYDELANRALSSSDRFGDWLGSVAGEFGGQAQKQYGFADEQQGRYKNTFAPIEDKLASDAMNWDSAGRMEAQAGEAKADAMAAGQQAKDASTRAMMSMGVNPNSGKFAAADRSNSTQVALAAAGAQNAARDNVRMQAQQLRGGAAQVGQQVLGNANNARALGLQATSAQQNATQAANGAITAGISQAGQLKGAGLGAAGVGYQGISTGLNAGNSAVGNQGAGMTSFNAGNQAMMNGFTTSGGLVANGAGIANNLYGNQLNAWNAENQSKGAMWQGIGTAAAAAAAAY
jgi:hypothetical protein